MSRKIDRIRQSLSALQPEYLDTQDESHMHSRGVETHYKAVIVSDVFTGQRALQRHQQVYRTLAGLMDEIHALALHTYTPEDWAKAGSAPASPRCRGGSKHDKVAAAA